MLFIDVDDLPVRGGVLISETGNCKLKISWNCYFSIFALKSPLTHSKCVEIRPQTESTECFKTTSKCLWIQVLQGVSKRPGNAFEFMFYKVSQNELEMPLNQSLQGDSKRAGNAIKSKSTGWLKTSWKCLAFNSYRVLKMFENWSIGQYHAQTIDFRYDFRFDTIPLPIYRYRDTKF